MANYAFDLNDKDVLKAIKRLNLTRKKEKLQTYNRIQSVFFSVGGPDPMMEGRLLRPSLRFASTVTSLVIQDAKYHLIDMKAQTTKFDSNHVDYFDYILNDDEVIGLIQAGMYRGDFQAFNNALNSVFVGKEFKIVNGVTYYSKKLDGVTVVAYEDQDQSLNSRQLDSSKVHDLDLDKKVQDMSVQRVMEQVQDKDAERLTQVLIEREIDFDNVQINEEKALERAVDDRTTRKDISLEEFVADVDKENVGLNNSKNTQQNLAQEANFEKEITKISTGDEEMGHDGFDKVFPPIKIDKSDGSVVYSDEKESREFSDEIGI